MFLTRPQMIVAFASVALAIYVLDLVRRRRLSEDFSLLWLVSSAVIALLAFSTGLLEAVTNALGILYESSTVFAAGIGFAIVLLLYVSVRLSRLSHENMVLARELALLRHSIEQGAPGPVGDPSRTDRT